MNLPDVQQLAQWPTLIVLGVCSFAGIALKRTPWLSSHTWVIPYLLAPIGAGAGWILLGENLNAAILGVLLAGISVYGHQLVTQWKNKPAKEDET